MDLMNDVISRQLKNLANFRYENELQTMQCVFNIPSDVLNLSNIWLKQLTAEKHSLPDNAKSNEFRKMGNKALENKQLLSAAAFYTKAICAAIACSDTLAFAHANRAQALLDFGYYKAAYDDCICALENSYPQKLKHKVLLRQATCAAKLQNVQELQAHLRELQDMTLNTQCNSELSRLQQIYTQLNDNAEKAEMSKVEVNCTELVQTRAGRCLKAHQHINKNEFVFSDTAYSWVTAGDRIKCEYCLTNIYIPFPCVFCHASVHYCSLSCRRQGALIHQYECAGYRLNLYPSVGLAHLALRTVLQGLPQLVPMLCTCHNAADIWQAIFKLTKDQTDYTATLHLQSQFTWECTEDIKYYALAAYTILQYLIQYTHFFDNIKCNITNWHIVVTALLVRHMGQFIINAHEIITLKLNESTNCLFSEEMWCGAQRLKRGQLHKFHRFGVIAAANFPYLSMTNHSCVPSFQTVFNGRMVRTHALKRIERGEEVFNCYTLCCHSATKLQRMDALRQHNFRCACDMCTLPNPDLHYVS